MNPVQPYMELRKWLDNTKKNVSLINEGEIEVTLNGKKFTGLTRFVNSITPIY